MILDEAEQLLGIVDGSHRLLEDELVVLDGPSHLFVDEHGLQSLGPLSESAGLVVSQSGLSGRKAALHGGLMTGGVVVVVADVANYAGICVVDSIVGADHGIANGDRCGDHFASQMLADHLVEGVLAGDPQIAASDVPPA